VRGYMADTHQPTPWSHVSSHIWQARRDSNPQHPVLETGALAVGATGLFSSLFALSMEGVSPTECTKLFKGKPIRRPPLVLGGRIVPAFALRTSQGNDVSHNLFQNFSGPPWGVGALERAFRVGRPLASGAGVRWGGRPAVGQASPPAILIIPSNYSTISLTTPAPTVRPPSRMAKRSSFSRATGVIKVTSMATLSPGITISTPSGSVATPVTSVVRR
jgi:hypothetical protein